MPTVFLDDKKKKKNQEPLDPRLSGSTYNFFSFLAAFLCGRESFNVKEKRGSRFLGKVTEIYLIK